MARSKHSVAGRRRVSPLLIYPGALLLVLFSVLPLIWIMSTAIKLPTEIFVFPPRWIPDAPTLRNYVDVFRDERMRLYFLNSVILATLSSSVTLAAGIPAAYALSRFRIPFRRTMFLIILFGRMLPSAAVMVPYFIILSRLHLLNTYPGLSFVYLVTTLPLSIWMLKGFFDTIPEELAEAAQVDGCSRLSAMVRVVVPVALPSIFATGMYSFILAWNEFILALVLTTGKAIRPVSVGLSLYLGEYDVDWGHLMAASVLMTLPSILVFLIFQRYLVSGLAKGAVKG